MGQNEPLDFFKIKNSSSLNLSLQYLRKIRLLEMIWNCCARNKKTNKTDKKKHFFPIAMETKQTNTNEPENGADPRADRFDYHLNF